MDYAKAADKVFQAIQQRIEKAIGPFQERLDSLHDQIKSLPAPRDGKDGVDGQTPTAEQLKALIEPLIPAPVAGKDGVNGDDGHTPTPDELKQIIAPLIPAPIAGKDGIDGRTPTADEIKALIPAPIPGEQGEPGQKGDRGEDGHDGKSFTIEEAQALIDKAVSDKQREWALDFERRAQELFQRAVERIPVPKDGKDGRDAVDVDGLSLSIEGRNLTVTLKRSDVVIASHTVRIAAVIDSGIWKEQQRYEQGDGVTWGGSWFIAQKDEPQGKPGTSSDWRLAAKRGRDGKDGRNGIDKTAAVTLT